MAQRCNGRENTSHNPHCEHELVPCDNCGHWTSPTPAISNSSHNTLEASSDAMLPCSLVPPASSSSSSLDLHQCAQCRFLTLLPSRTPSLFCMRRLLHLPSAFTWSLSRVWLFQLHLRSDAYIDQRTQWYLSKLDEFRTIAAAMRSNLTSTPPSTLSSSSCSPSGGRLAGAQPQEESKSSDDMQNLHPPSQPTAAEANLAEQQLLQAREQLLQCVELKERIDRASAEQDVDELDDFRTDIGSTKPFQKSHLNIMKMLCTAASPSSPLLLSPSLLSLIESFLHDRESILTEKGKLEDAWQLLRTIDHARGDMSAQNVSEDPTSSSTSPDVASTTFSVLSNIFECRYRKQKILLQLRLEQFQPLLIQLNQVLKQLYLAFHAAVAAEPLEQFLPPSIRTATQSALPPSLASATASSSSSSPSLHEGWCALVDRVCAEEHAQGTPASFATRARDAHHSQQVVEVEIISLPLHLKSLTSSDLTLLIEYARHLYSDVFHVIKMRSRPLSARSTSSAEEREKVSMETDSSDLAQSRLPAAPVTPQPTKHVADLAYAASSASRRSQPPPSPSIEVSSFDSANAKSKQQTHKHRQAHSHPYQR